MKMKKELRRATPGEIVTYLEFLRSLNPKNEWKKFAIDQEIKYISMSDEEIYHYCLDKPVTDHGSYKVEAGESGEVPRLFMNGKNFISMGVPLRELRDIIN